MSGFRKASKKKAKLRLAVWGPPKAGKTMTALRIAKGLAAKLNTKIAAIDTERESMDFYADVVDFDTDSSMKEFSPAEYVQRIRAAATAGYGVLIVDSLSHAWSGTGGALDMKDAAAKKGAAKNGVENTYTAWRDVTPEHNRLVEALLQYPGHVIVTIRSKIDYEMVKDERGKTQVRKVGLAPVQREGLEYEFTMLAQINEENDLIVSGSRISPLNGKVFHQAGEEFAEACLDWLEKGEDVVPPLTETTRERLMDLCGELGVKTGVGAFLRPMNGGENIETEAQGAKVVDELLRRIAAKSTNGEAATH